MTRILKLVFLAMLISSGASGQRADHFSFVQNHHRAPSSLPTWHKVDYAIGIDLGKIPLFTLKGYFEKVFADTYSLEVSGFLTYENVQFFGANAQMAVFGGDIGVKYYFLNEANIAPEGWYVTGFVKLQSSEIIARLPNRDFSRLVKGVGIMPGLRLGHQFAIGHFGLLDIGLGAGFQHTSSNGRFNTNGKFLLFAWNGITPSWKLGFAKTF